MNALQGFVTRIGRLHALNLDEGFGTVEMPYALARKFPGESRSLKWQFVFAAPQRGTDPISGEIRRHHLHPTTLEKSAAFRGP